MRKRPRAARRSLTAAAAAAALAAGAALAACGSPGSVAGPAGAPGTAAVPALASVPSGADGTPGPTRTPAPRSTRHAPAGTQVSGTLQNGTSWVAEYPAGWNGTLILYSHGYGALAAADAPDGPTQSALLARGYALAGSSYDPNGSEWALGTAVSDQFGTLTAVETSVLPSQPGHVIAFGTSMGGLVSALEAERGQGRIDGALTACGVVAGGVNLVEYQLDGQYAIAQLLGSPGLALTGLTGGSPASAAAALSADGAQAQQTAAGRARLALAMAFLNVAPWDPSAYAPAPASDPAAQESAQYDALFGGAFSSLDFVVAGRTSIEQSAGGQPAWDAGANFAALLAGSPYKPEVAALYQAAGLNLDADLATLTAHAAVKANPAALSALKASSDPTGRLAVPELDLHTIGDNLVPVQNENYYARLVAQAGSGGLLRQAYTDSFGHCNFSVSEQVAGIEAVLHRVTSGQWGNVATAAGLEQAAGALRLGQASFTAYSPGALTGAVPAS
jgi:hypothetical protein